MPGKVKSPLEFANIFVNISDLGLVFVRKRHSGEIAQLLENVHAYKTISNNAALSPRLLLG